MAMVMGLYRSDNRECFSSSSAGAELVSKDAPRQVSFLPQLTRPESQSERKSSRFLADVLLKSSIQMETATLQAPLDGSWIREKA
jgi:hypothetical protein